ncbi:MAG: ligase-associated DNA damage response endonuclease PdeM [Planctomycetota bacterium]
MTGPAPSIEVELSGERVRLLADRAAYWPARETLIVSDVHLGKDQTLRAAGAPMVEGCLEHDLRRLSALVEQTACSRLLVTGDLVHATAGLGGGLLERVAEWRRSLGVEVWLVRGNHDRAVGRFGRLWELEVVEPPLVEGPLAFVHEPAEVDGAHAIGGHVHPVVLLKPRSRGRRFAGGGGAPIRMHCFRVGERVTVLPAFGSFISGAVGEPRLGERVFGCVEGCVVEVPLG